MKVGQPGNAGVRHLLDQPRERLLLRPPRGDTKKQRLNRCSTVVPFGHAIDWSDATPGEHRMFDQLYMLTGQTALSDLQNDRYAGAKLRRFADFSAQTLAK